MPSTFACNYHINFGNGPFAPFSCKICGPAAEGEIPTFEAVNKMLYMAFMDLEKASVSPKTASCLD